MDVKGMEERVWLELSRRKEMKEQGQRRAARMEPGRDRSANH